jgi:hypothetical protein
MTARLLRIQHDPAPPALPGLGITMIRCRIALDVSSSGAMHGK